MSGGESRRRTGAYAGEIYRTTMLTLATRWEYTMLKIDVYRGITGPHIDVDRIDSRLDELGGEGWELVSLVGANAGEGRTSDLVAVLKRPIV